MSPIAAALVNWNELWKITFTALVGGTGLRARNGTLRPMTARKRSGRNCAVCHAAREGNGDSRGAVSHRGGPPLDAQELGSNANTEAVCDRRLVGRRFALGKGSQSVNADCQYSHD